MVKYAGFYVEADTEEEAEEKAEYVPESEFEFSAMQDGGGWEVSSVTPDSEID